MNLFDEEDIRIMEYNAITGLVDYGVTSKKNLWITKMRCKICGAAWIAEDYVGGTDICPKCSTTGKNVIFAPKI